jgi:isocitrate dehydrogenase kinase/phosphatase
MVLTENSVFDEIATLLASMDAQRVLNFHASSKAQQRMEELQWKNKESKLTPEEKIEIERYLVVEHIVRLAKIRAQKRLQEV